jgi:hypothetical protein
MISVLGRRRLLDQRAEALEALARRYELDRASLHGHVVTALRGSAQRRGHAFRDVREVRPGDGGSQRTKRLAVAD